MLSPTPPLTYTPTLLPICTFGNLHFQSVAQLNHFLMAHTWVLLNQLISIHPPHIVTYMLYSSITLMMTRVKHCFKLHLLFPPSVEMIKFEFIKLLTWHAKHTIVISHNTDNQKESWRTSKWSGKVERLRSTEMLLRYSPSGKVIPHRVGDWTQLCSPQGCLQKRILHLVVVSAHMD